MAAKRVNFMKSITSKHYPMYDEDDLAYPLAHLVFNLWQVLCCNLSYVYIPSTTILLNSHAPQKRFFVIAT